MTKTQQIAEGWNSYAYSNSLKPGTKKYAELQHTYINGASSVLGAGLPPIIQIYVMCGRDLADLDQSMDEATA
jgi:hypothetical protein